MGWYNGGVGIYVNNANLSSFSYDSSAHTLQIALDETHSPPLFWGRVDSGNWNNIGGATPGDSNGIALTGLVSTGGLYPALGGVGSVSQTFTANFGGSFFGSVPSGFQPCSAYSTLTTSSGTPTVGQSITGSGIAPGTYIIAGSGTSWTVNGLQTVSSEAISLYNPTTWSFKGQSDVLYLDAATLAWMFPGLGITVYGGIYTVTGVHPHLGYVTVMSAATNGGAPLSGNKTTVYSCSSGCAIGQAPFSWTAY